MSIQIITGTYSSGIVLSNGNYTNPVTVTSTGSITGTSYGLSAATAWTIVNQGGVDGQNYGALLNAGGQISNAAGGAIIGGSFGVRVFGGAGIVENAGSIGGGNNTGINLTFGGSVTNVVGGAITGGLFGVSVSGASGAVENAGTIDGAKYDGVFLGAGGFVTNASGGAISGGNTGIYVYKASGTIENTGSISGATFGVLLGADGSVNNAAGGAITASQYTAIFIRDAAATVENAGSVGGSAFGVLLDNGGTVTNAAGGAITGVQYTGVFARNSPATVENAGSIGGPTFGVLLSGGGSVTNAAGGIIGNGYGGVFVRGDSGTVDNWGRVSATGKAAVLEAGGSVTNTAEGTITAGGFGIIVTGASGTVQNAGAISTNGYEGVALDAGGTVTNLSGGSIKGGIIGVYLVNDPGTVENAGTITGAYGAVAFSTGGDTLIVDPGAVFNGGVSANGAGNILELNTTSAPQTLTGLGSQFNGFQTLVFEAGAAWTAAGSFAGVTTIGGFLPGDTLDLTGVSYAAGDTVILTSANVLEVLDSSATVLWSAQLESSSLGNISYSGKVFHIAYDGGSGTDITVNDATTSWTARGAGDWHSATAWSAGQTPDSPDTEAIIAKPGSTVSILPGESFQVNQLTIGYATDRLILAGSLTTAKGLTLSAGRVVMAGGSLTGPLSIATGTRLAGAGTVTGTVANDGRVDAAGSTLDLTGAVTGNGVLKIDNGATLELGADSASQTITFAVPANTDETLILDVPGDSFGIIRGFALGDTIDLKNVTTTSHSFFKGTLTVLDGTTAVATLRFGSTFPGEHFVLTSDEAGGTDITLAPDTLKAPALVADRSNALFVQAITTHSASQSTATDSAVHDRHSETLSAMIAAAFRH